MKNSEDAKLYEDVGRLVQDNIKKENESKKAYEKRLIKKYEAMVKVPKSVRKKQKEMMRRQEKKMSQLPVIPRDQIVRPAQRGRPAQRKRIFPKSTDNESNDNESDDQEEDDEEDDDDEETEDTLQSDMYGIQSDMYDVEKVRIPRINLLTAPWIPGHLSDAETESEADTVFSDVGETESKAETESEPDASARYENITPKRKKITTR
jgi:hypothetical protein